MNACENLVVLLGAGSSLPGMSTVRDLTEFLLAWRGRLEPPQDPGDTSRDILTLPLVEDDSRQPLFKALRDQLAPTFRDADQIDFEMLIHLSDAVLLARMIASHSELLSQARYDKEKYIQWVAGGCKR